LSIERSAAAILRWSSWRRWHQAWARYYHYRRREQAGGGRERAAPEAAQAAEAQIDVSELVWRRLEQLLPPADRVGRPYDYARRLVLEAIVYLMQTDCGWRNLPSRFPPWQTVSAQLTQWRRTGIWDIIWSGLEQPHPIEQLQL
jgi:transposase